METGKRFRARLRGPSALVGAGAAFALALLFVVVSAGVAGRMSAREASTAAVDGTHTPPLLTVKGEPVRLAYDLNCESVDPVGCTGSGVAYVRTGQAGAFTAYPLRFDPTAPSGRYFLDVPSDIATAPDGFSYYAVLTTAGGARVTVPSAGPSAPDASFPMADTQLIGASHLRGASSRLGTHRAIALDVALGIHRFGATRAATERVATAAWGDGPGEVGLEGGPESTPIGASSFDVTPRGTIQVLDEAHKRLVEWSHAHAIASTPLDIKGTLADLAVESDGSTDVLESVGDAEDEHPAIRHFDARGRLVATSEVSERSAAAIRVGPHGPAALEYPSNHWMDVADAAGPLDGAQQAKRGHLGRDAKTGQRVLVFRTGQELRVALVDADGVRRGWRIVSATPLAEVQLAEPLANGLVVVVRTYTDAASEFEVVVLSRSGVVQRFAVPASDWAETAPVSRFRLSGHSLFQLGSTPSGMFVDRYDLGG